MVTSQTMRPSVELVRKLRQGEAFCLQQRLACEPLFHLTGSAGPDSVYVCR